MCAHSPWSIWHILTHGFKVSCIALWCFMPSCCKHHSVDSDLFHPVGQCRLVSVSLLQLGYLLHQEDLRPVPSKCLGGVRWVNHGNISLNQNKTYSKTYEIRDPTATIDWYGCGKIWHNEYSNERIDPTRHIHTASVWSTTPNMCHLGVHLRVLYREIV